MLPGGAILLCTALLDYFGWLTLTLPGLNFLYFCGLIGGGLLAWRFHASRIFFVLCVLFIAQQAAAKFSGTPQSPGMLLVNAVAVLVPLNFILVVLIEERGFSVASVGPFGLLLFLETSVVAVIYRNAEGVASGHRLMAHVSRTITIPNYGLYIFFGAALLLLVRYLITHKPVDSALFWSLVAFFLSLHSAGNARVSLLYLSAAVVIPAIAIIENSYLLAYHDELTSLPSRRAFNDALLRLQFPYSIAVVDIDHFKQFNDKYGHDTGDQVLRLVAANLSRVTGGGQAYRCGGEEFTILFPGRLTHEVVDHLERLRLGIECSEFRMRGNDRRQIPRGADRRDARTNKRTRNKGDAIRRLAQEQPVKPLSVTVSIGVASAESDESDPQQVLQSADKALYRAKANGRNRLEAASSKRRPKSKAAGIA